jgi:hypothetical protein
MAEFAFFLNALRAYAFLGVNKNESELVPGRPTLLLLHAKLPYKLYMVRV